MRQLLAASGIRLTKSLGQTFLHDANQLRRIVAAAELTKADRVLEIGPGLGPLTELLVEQAGEVLAIEKDARLVEVLKERFSAGPASRLSLSGKGTGGTPVLHLLHDDALDYLSREARDWSEWKLVANLPYSVASPILVELALGRRASPRAQTTPGDGAGSDTRLPAQPTTGQSQGRGPQRMVATLQIEVAKRLMAKPGTPDYGLLTLLVQLDYEPQRLVQNSGQLLLPGAGRGLRLRLPGAPRAGAAPAGAAAHVCPDCETQLLPAAQDDVQTAEGGLA